MSTHFLLQIYFIKVFSQLLFLFSKIAGMGGILFDIILFSGNHGDTTQGS
jgi:hypothetical protein